MPTNIGQDITTGYSIYGNLRRGGTTGDITAADQAASLGARTGAWGAESGSIGTGAGVVGGGLEILQGLKQKGVAGYSEAALGAAQIAEEAGVVSGSSALGEAIPIAGAALSAYEFAKNWQSGNTGSDAIQGAETGAAIGSLFGPIGAGVGLVIGGAAGAISSIFGPGRKDPESSTFGGYATAFNKGGPAAVANPSPAEAFQSLAGLFDLRSGQISGNIPIYKQFGRMGENQFVSSMTGQINSALARGIIDKNTPPDQIYQKVVTPWVNSFGHGAMNDPNAGAIQNMITQLIGQWQSGKLNANTPVGIAGQKIQGLQQYGAQGFHATGVPPGHAVSSKIPSRPGANMPGAPAMSWTDPNSLSTVGATGTTGNMGATSAGTPAGLGFKTGGPMTSPLVTAQGSSGGAGGAALGAAAAGTAGALLGYNPQPMQPGQTVQTDQSDGGGGGDLLGLGIGAGAGLFGLKAAQGSASSTIGPLNATAGPTIAAGQDLLGQSLTGQLTPQQQQVVNTSQTQGQTLINAATPIGQIAQGLMQQYQSGQLKPADQAQLDQQVTAAKAQLRQSLGSNVDSSQLATYDAQIDQQAKITKQQMLNSYLATGNQEFDQWATTTEAGQKTMLEGQQYAVTQIDNTFSKALAALGLGGDQLLSAIQLTMNSNTQLANAFGSYMGNLTKAYAMTAASGGGGGGIGSAVAKMFGGGGGAGSTTSLTSGGSDSPASDLNMGADQQAAYDQLGISTDALTQSTAQQIASGTSFSDQASQGVPSYQSYASYAGG